MTDHSDLVRSIEVAIETSTKYLPHLVHFHVEVDEDRDIETSWLRVTITQTGRDVFTGENYLIGKLRVDEYERVFLQAPPDHDPWIEVTSVWETLIVIINSCLEQYCNYTDHTGW